MKWISACILSFLGLIVAGAWAFGQSGITSVDKYTGNAAIDAEGKPQTARITKSEAQWRKLLTPPQFQILRLAATEPAYDNAFWDNHQDGTYYCAACGQKLFSSDTKFDSHTGWPSFWQPATKDAVLYRRDLSDGMSRIEVLCANCGSHLGHVFDDGPAPTGQRYCMNSGAMKFVAKKK